MSEWKYQWVHKEKSTTGINDQQTILAGNPIVVNEKVAPDCPYKLPCGICTMLDKECPKDRRYEITC